MILFNRNTEALNGNLYEVDYCLEEKCRASFFEHALQR